MNPSTAFAAVLADEFARCGLREVVVAPGSRSTPLAMAFWELDRAGRVRLHVRIDERSAAFTALGLAKASRRPVAVLCTSGTAAGNFHPAVIEADESAVPLLVLTADRPPELRGTGASQTIDQVKLYGSAVRWYAESGVPERRAGMAGYWRSLACRAWASAAGATGTLPGPVHLNLPFRDPLVPDILVPDTAAPDPAVRAGVADNSNKRASADAGHAGPAALPREVPAFGDPDWPEPLAGRADGGPWTRVSAAAAVAGPLELPWAERGVVVCGDGDYDSAALVELAERAGWPVLAEPSSGARRGPNALTGYQYLLASPGFMAAHRPQVIISAGRPGLSRPQSALLGLARAAAGRPPGSAIAPGGADSAADPGADDETARASRVSDPAGVPAIRHVVIAQGPGMWADPQRAATDVAASVRLTGAPGTVQVRWLDAWRRADAAATRAAGAVLDAWRAGPAGGESAIGEPGPDVAGRVPGAPPGGLAANPLAPPGAAPPGAGPAGGASAPAGVAPAGAAHAADSGIAVTGGRLPPPAERGLSEPEIARELVAALPENAVLWCGNSLSVRDIDLLMPPRADARVIASRGASGIDGTFSTAAGAALAHAVEHPGAVAFALIGDLTLLHDAPGLAIGPAEPRPDLCVVVVNNDGGGIFEGLEPARFKDGGAGDCPSVFERVFGTAHGASIERLAAAFGIPYTLAERTGDLAKAMASALPGTGPRIIEARTGRAANADLRAGMRAAAIRAVTVADGLARPE